MKILRNATSVCVLVIVVLVLGLFSPTSMSESDSSKPGFEFVWAAHEEDSGYFFELKPGAENSCRYDSEDRGGFTHELGLGSFTFSTGPHESMDKSYRVDDSVHIGSWNTAHFTGPAWASLGAWYQGFGWGIVEGEQLLSHMGIAMDTQSPIQGYLNLKIECDQTPDLRFFIADVIQPILSHTLTGGIGFNQAPMQVVPSISNAMNWGDRVEIDTSGSRVVFAASEVQRPEMIGESHVEGQIVLGGPDGEETIPLEMGELPFQLYHRIWSTSGVYSMELDRFATNYAPFGGVLAGFILHEEWEGASSQGLACSGSGNFTMDHEFQQEGGESRFLQREIPSSSSDGCTD